MFHFFSSSIEVLRMQRENQQLRKTIDELEHSGDRIIELEAENEQLQKANMEAKNTVFTLNEVRNNCNMVSIVRELTRPQSISCQKTFSRKNKKPTELVKTKIHNRQLKWKKIGSNRFKILRELMVILI